MFEEFSPVSYEHEGVEIRAWTSGAGSPVLLLHGYPQTHQMWHRVAPELAKHHTVVAADLRGYGDSDKPTPTEDRSNYSKRAMADDQHRLMASLGFDHYAVVGHDRGGRVAHRLGLDRPEAVDRIAVLDIIPTLHMFDNVDRGMATSYFHWFFLAKRGGMPEALQRADPRTWLRSRFEGRHAGGDPIADEAYAEYERCFLLPGSIEGSTADYQAAATIDLEHDRADRDRGKRLEMPLLALWGASSYVGRHFDVTSVWSHFAHTVTGTPIASDHYLAEEAPDAVTAQLLDFFAEEAAA